LSDKLFGYDVVIVMREREYRYLGGIPTFASLCIVAARAILSANGELSKCPSVASSNYLISLRSSTASDTHIAKTPSLTGFIVLSMSFAVLAVDHGRIIESYPIRVLALRFHRSSWIQMALPGHEPIWVHIRP